MSQVINVRQSVGALVENTTVSNIQTNGILSQILVHFPPGANALVDVQVFLGTTQILPQTGAIALDDASPNFNFNIPVIPGQKLNTVITNTDSANSHTISVIINILDKPVPFV